jgi:hypothetical protein
MTWASHHIEKLRRGEPVKFRPHGNSMTGRIENGQLVTVVPCGLRGDISAYEHEGVVAHVQVGAAVLCKVGKSVLVHLVTAIRAGQYQISNNRGHVNGWTQARNIYGIVTLVEP